MTNVKCPQCGESNYAILTSATTAMYYPPVIKNGVNVNPDGNITTTTCRCMYCGNLFGYQTRYGKIWNGYER